MRVRAEFRSLRCKRQLNCFSEACRERMSGVALGRGITTKSMLGDSSCFVRRNDSRRSRFHRLRMTAFPHFLETIKPSLVDRFAPSQPWITIIASATEQCWLKTRSNSAARNKRAVLGKLASGISDVCYRTVRGIMGLFGTH